MTRTARLFAGGTAAAVVIATVAAALPDPPRPAAPPPRPVQVPLATEAEARAALARPAPADLPSGSFYDLADRLFADHRLVVRADLSEFRRLQAPADPDEYLTAKLPPVRTRGLTVADVLAVVAARLDRPGDPDRVRDWGHAFRVRGGQVLLVPAFRPPSLPGDGARADFQPVVSQEVLAEQLHGPPVSGVFDAPFARAVEQLRTLTGANLVLDPRAKEQAVARVAGTFDDVRLLTVLQVLAD